MLKSVFGLAGLTLLGAAAFALGCEGEDEASAPTGESVLKLVPCGSTANEIKGCVAKTGGALRVIGARASCALTETTLCWSQTGPQGANSLTAVTPLLAGDVTCPAGGSLLSVGTDTDNDAALEPTEVDATAAVCNGKVSLLRVTDEPAGANCPNGGEKIETGLDDDGDGVLEASEVDTAATEYVCTPCPAGFTESGATCVDVNECTAGTDDCDPHATCINRDGGYDCECNLDFKGDGYSCAYDFSGLWQGTTSQGQEILMRVADGIVQAIRINYTLTGSGGCTEPGTLDLLSLEEPLGSTRDFSITSLNTVSLSMTGEVSSPLLPYAEGDFYISSSGSCAGSISGTWTMEIPPLCGDGIEMGAESCDDGNTTNGDGCSSACQLPGYFAESEPNDDGEIGTLQPMSGSGDFSTVNADGVFSSDIVLVGSIVPAGDEDVYAVTNLGATTANVRFETFENPELDFCSSATDTVLTIRDAAGTSLFHNDDLTPAIPNWWCSQIPSVLIGSGETVYAHVRRYGDNQLLGRYFLEVDFL